MRLAIFLALISAAIGVTGCNAAPEKPAETAPTANGTQEPVLGPENVPESEAKMNLPADTEWRMLYGNQNNADVAAMFEKARQIVVDKKGLKGKLNHWSRYYGPWVIVEIEPEPVNPEMIPTDQRAPRNRAFLVDMTTETLIETGDWKAAKPFFDALLTAWRQGFDDARGEKSFIAHMAASASTVGLGHTSYIEDSGDGRYHSPVTGPQFSRGMDKFELVYFVNETAMRIAYTKCTLTMTNSSLIFNSELVSPNMDD